MKKVNKNPQRAYRRDTNAKGKSVSGDSKECLTKFTDEDNKQAN